MEIDTKIYLTERTQPEIWKITQNIARDLEFRGQPSRRQQIFIDFCNPRLENVTKRYQDQFGSINTTRDLMYRVKFQQIFQMTSFNDVTTS